MTALREDAWGRMVEPRDGKMGEWFDARRAGLPASVDQLSGDLICPICEAPLEITAYSEGFCARCMAHVEIAQ